MIIPEKLKVLGLDFEIKNDRSIAEHSATWGSTSHSAQVINLDPTATITHREQIFLHEMLHAIWWQMGLTKLPDVDEKKEEQIVNALANGLHQVLKDNNLLL